MKKITRLTERDLTRLVKRVIKEDSHSSYEERLEEMKDKLDNILEDLYYMEDEIDRDEDLNREEKEDLLYFVGDLIKRCDKKKKR